MPLSERLTAVASMVTPGLKVADVGCDHGYLAIYLIKKGISPGVIAMDINQGPLQRAEENIREAGFASNIDTRLSDGLDKLECGEVQSIVMAGMGGPLMTDIIERGADVCDKARELILQPQSEQGGVRHYLEDHGYRIISEDIVLEDGKYYPMMKAVHGEMNLENEVYYRYGKILLKEEHPILRAYLRYEREMLRSIRDGLMDTEQTQRVSERLKELEHDIAIVNEAISMSERISPVTVERVLK